MEAVHLCGAVPQAATYVWGGAEGFGGMLAGPTASLARGGLRLCKFLGGARLLDLGGLGGKLGGGGL